MLDGLSTKSIVMCSIEKQTCHGLVFYLCGHLSWWTSGCSLCAAIRRRIICEKAEGNERENMKSKGPCMCGVMNGDLGIRDFFVSCLFSGKLGDPRRPLWLNGFVS